MKKLLILLLLSHSTTFGVNEQLAQNTNDAMSGQKSTLNADLAVSENPASTSPELKAGNNAAFVYYQRINDINGIIDSQTNEEKIYFYDSTFRYPMNTNPCNQEFIGKLSADEHNMMINYEYSFMEERLKHNVGKDIHILAIPKTLYQLFVGLLYWREITPIIEKNDTKKSIFFWKEYSYGNNDIRASLEEKQRSLAQSCIHATRRNGTKILFWSVNNMILDFLKSSGIDLLEVENPSAINSLARQVYREIGLKMSLVPRNDAFQQTKMITTRSMFWICLKDRDTHITNATKIEENVATTVMQEYQTQEDLQYSGTVRCYRGGHIAEGISYSNGAFGGLIFDAQTGCAFSYTCPPRSNLFLFAVDLKKGDARMYVPYISSLLASLGEGEFHHPRIKVVAPGDTMAPGV
ncbi:MAG: hypothetical protein LBB25_02955, partial [Holosporaceae bacterium]|nr:hypothetical protein [Holosporaceae bacterium]